MSSFWDKIVKQNCNICIKFIYWNSGCFLPISRIQFPRFFQGSFPGFRVIAYHIRSSSQSSAPLLVTTGRCAVYLSRPFPEKKKHFDINHCQDYSMYSVTKSWIGRGMQKPEHQSFAYRVKNKSAQKTSKQILYDTFPLKCFLRLFTLCLRCLKTLNQNNGKSKCTKTKPGKWI